MQLYFINLKLCYQSVDHSMDQWVMGHKYDGLPLFENGPPSCLAKSDKFNQHLDTSLVKLAC